MQPELLRLDVLKYQTIIILEGKTVKKGQRFRKTENQTICSLFNRNKYLVFGENHARPKNRHPQKNALVPVLNNTLLT